MSARRNITVKGNGYHVTGPVLPAGRSGLASPIHNDSGSRQRPPELFSPVGKSPVCEATQVSPGSSALCEQVGRSATGLCMAVDELLAEAEANASPDAIIDNSPGARFARSLRFFETLAGIRYPDFSDLATEVAEDPAGLPPDDVDRQYEWVLASLSGMRPGDEGPYV